MKLTCCCGSSIELGEDAEYPAHGGAPRCVVEFRQYHEPCVLAWRRSVITGERVCSASAWPEAYRRLLDMGFTPEAARKLIVEPPDIKWDTQTMPHPNYYVNWRKRYQRFIDAVGNFGRVFHIVDGRLLATLTMIAYDGTAPPSEELFIEGVDVPMCPQFNWLEKNGVISTGECRVPNIGELFAAINTWNGQPRSVMLCEFCKRVIDDYWSFNGRRWILKRESEG